MMVRFRFQLRTLFLVMTATAACAGVRLGIFLGIGYKRGKNDLFDDIVNVHIWGDLPYFLVCALGAKWIVEQRGSDHIAKRLALSALAIGVFWNLLGNWLTRFFLCPRNQPVEELLFYMNVVTLMSYSIQAACWLLLILAYLRLGEFVHTSE